jgi:hypothetical protein
MSEQRLFKCSECGATKLYGDDIDELPPEWFRLEDRAWVSILCSVRCLLGLGKAIELTRLVDAVGVTPPRSPSDEEQKE